MNPRPLIPRAARAAVLAATLLIGGSLRPATAEEVALQLLFAVDFSPSIDSAEYALQIHGLAQALRHPDVVDAISGLRPNGVAMAVMQWAGPREQTLSVPWTGVRDRPTAEAFAARIDSLVRPVTDGGTAIGDALARGMSFLAASGFNGRREVIDISGDGSTNIGDSPAPVRLRAASSGITINGLVILNEEPLLGDYYHKRVIGGPGAFLLEVRNFDDFALAIRMKLIREIEVSMATSPSPLE